MVKNAIKISKRKIIIDNRYTLSEKLKVIHVKRGKPMHKKKDYISKFDALLWLRVDNFNLPKAT